jgi:Tetratricopeptide repeat
MYQRALQGYEKVSGTDHHISTLNTVYSFGILYETQGKLAEAGMMYQRALQGYEKVHDHNHQKC